MSEILGFTPDQMEDAKDDFQGVQKVGGLPISWFERCDTLNADWWIFDGKAYMDGMGGPLAIPIRLRPEFRNLYGGWGANYAIPTLLLPEGCQEIRLALSSEQATLLVMCLASVGVMASQSPAAAADPAYERAVDGLGAWVSATIETKFDVLPNQKPAVLPNQKPAVLFGRRALNREFRLRTKSASRNSKDCGRRAKGRSRSGGA